MEDRFISEKYLDMYGPDHGMRDGDGHFTGYHENLNHIHYDGRPSPPTVREVIDFAEKMTSLFNKQEEKPNESWAVKKNENNKNALESFQWLSHIIYRYDTLADVTFFIQGHPHDHLPDWRELSHVEVPSDFTFSTLPSNSMARKFTIDSDFDTQTISLWEKVYKDPSKFDQQAAVWVMGAQFAASKEVIRSKPLSWYIQLKAIAAHHKYSAHALERTWWEVFGRPKLSSLEI